MQNQTRSSFVVFADAAMTYDSCHMHLSAIICSFNVNIEIASKLVVLRCRAFWCLFFSISSSCHECFLDATCLHIWPIASEMFNRPQNWMIMVWDHADKIQRSQKYDKNIFRDSTFAIDHMTFCTLILSIFIGGDPNAKHAWMTHIMWVDKFFQ